MEFIVQLFHYVQQPPNLSLGWIRITKGRNLSDVLHLG